MLQRTFPASSGKFDRSRYNAVSPNSEVGEHNICNVLAAPMAVKSQREDWYHVSPYIAEYYCFMSNLAIIAVGVRHRSLPTIFAGLMSAISHSIPTQFWHDLDMIGMGVVAIAALFNISTILKAPNFYETLAFGIFTISLNFLDIAITRNYGDVVGPWVHVAWHFAAAFALHKLNEAIASPNHNI